MRVDGNCFERFSVERARSQTGVSAVTCTVPNSDEPTP